MHFIKALGALQTVVSLGLMAYEIYAKVKKARAAKAAKSLAA